MRGGSVVRLGAEQRVRTWGILAGAIDDWQGADSGRLMIGRAMRATSSRVSEVSVRRNPLLANQKENVGGIAEGIVVAVGAIAVESCRDIVG